VKSVAMFSLGRFSLQFITDFDVLWCPVWEVATNLANGHPAKRAGRTSV